MVGLVDRRGKYWSQIDEKEVNRGNNGKLNADQTIERTRLHALRMAYGQPTLKGVTDVIYEKFGIRIHFTSEKEWSRRNEKSILDMMNRMVDAGEIKLPLTDTSHITTLSVSGVETARNIRIVEDHFRAVFKAIDLDFDPYKKLGKTEEEVDAMPDVERGKWIRKAQIEARKNEFRLSALATISKILNEQKTLLVKTVLATKQVFDDSKLKSKKFEIEAERKISQALDKHRATDEFNPLEVEVTDEMRAGGKHFNGKEE